ncbi:MAG: hypothetical protein K9H12_07205 [Bacteroidales bacterium]|nr:hypothetical protein [Bacteroidales bacterium]
MSDSEIEVLVERIPGILPGSGYRQLVYKVFMSDSEIEVLVEFMLNFFSANPGYSLNIYQSLNFEMQNLASVTESWLSGNSRVGQSRFQWPVRNSSSYRILSIAIP